MGGVRCLGLFPKKCQFFFTPSFSGGTTEGVAATVSLLVLTSGRRCCLQKYCFSETLPFSGGGNYVAGLRWGYDAHLDRGSPQAGE